MPRVDMSQLAVNFTGVQASEIFLDPIFIGSPLSEFFQIMPNIKNGKKKMLFAGAIDNILRQRTGCGFCPVGDLKINERCITTTDVKGETAQCWDEFQDTILLEALNSGIRKADLSGTILQNILLTRLQQGVERQLNLLAFFGDKATANEEQNIVDGLWTVYLPQLVTQGLTPRVNSLSGTALGAGNAIQLLDDVVDSTGNELDTFDASDKVILVTRAVWRQLQKDIRDGADGSTAFSSEVQDSKTMLFFDGIEVVKMSRWEGLAAQYMTNVLPGVTSNFNLVLLTHRRNLVLGTNMEADINTFETWYERKEEEYLTRTAFMLGFNYVHPSLMAVAY
jgi:hypothetical protein